MLAEDALASSPDEMRKRLIKELGGRYYKEESDGELRDAALKWRDFNGESCKEYIKDFLMGCEMPEATLKMEKRALALVVAHPLNKGVDK